MDRGGVAIIDMAVIRGVERNAAAIVELDGHALRIDLFNFAKNAILDAKIAVVTQKHQTVACRELAIPAFGVDGDVIAKLARVAELAARRVVQRAHFVVGMGKDDP